LIELPISAVSAVVRRTLPLFLKGPPLRFTKTLIGAGAAAAVLGVLATAAPALAVTPPPSPSSFTFDISANDTAGSLPQPSGHFSLTSATDFLGGKPVTMAWQNLGGVNGALTAPYYNSGWAQTASFDTTTGWSNIKLAQRGAVAGNSFLAYVSNMTIPTAGDTSMSFDFYPSNNSAAPAGIPHLSAVSDNQFLPGSTTTTTITVNDPTNQTQVSVDGGATWSASSASFSNHPGDTNPPIMAKSLWGSTWYYATLSNMTSLTLTPKPAPVSGVLVPFPAMSVIAPGATGPMRFALQNASASTVLFDFNTISGRSNPSSIVFTAPQNTTFPDQATVQLQGGGKTGTTWTNTALLGGSNCVTSNARTTLTCDLSGTPGSASIASGIVIDFTPLVTVDPAVPAGTVLNAGSADMHLYNQPSGGLVGMLAATAPQPLMTAPPAPGQPIYNEDGSVDIPGTGTPGATITVKDASGTVIGTATVAADGTYDVKIPAAQGGTVTVTESDMPGTTWPVTIATDLLGTPIVNPLIAGGTALVVVAGLGTVVLVRRRKAAVQA
jgi:hypothetical protein